MPGLAVSHDSQGGKAHESERHDLRLWGPNTILGCNHDRWVGITLPKRQHFICRCMFVPAIVIRVGGCLPTGMEQRGRCMRIASYPALMPFVAEPGSLESRHLGLEVSSGKPTGPNTATMTKEGANK